MGEDDPIYLERNGVPVRFRIGPGHLSAEMLVMARITEAIARGELRSGDKLPGREDIAAKLGISVDPVRRGLRQLRKQGVVTGGQGARWFVA